VALSPDIIRFGQFELDRTTGELRKGARTLRLQEQPLKILLMLLEAPGELVAREEMKQRLWANDTFVDFEHSLSAAINKLRTALGDSATDSRYIETLPRKGYRFIAPVSSSALQNSIGELHSESESHSLLTDPSEVPSTKPTFARGIFAGIQMMYLAFYISTLAGLHQLQDRLASLGAPGSAWVAIITLAVIGIPVRLYFLSSAGFQVKSLLKSFIKVFPLVFIFDELWAASPLLIVHYIGWGWALAAVAGLAYLPFSQRTLLFMAERRNAAA
jgi:cholera toxin transcriptional activator